MSDATNATGASDELTPSAPPTAGDTLGGDDVADPTRLGACQPDADTTAAEEGER
jgi:hypothetical protein